MYVSVIRRIYSLRVARVTSLGVVLCRNTGIPISGHILTKFDIPVVEMLYRY